MPEALSQQQIDELLQRMQAGNMDEVVEEEPSDEKLYDFSSPKKFTKDQIKSLNNLYETFCRSLSSYLTTTLRSVCEVNVTQIEELRYREFSNALPDSILIGLIDFKPENKQLGESTIIMEFPTSFGYLTIDRMMGGTGPGFFPDRDFTEVETALLTHIFEQVSIFMKEAWNNYFPLETSLLNIETNGRFLQAFSPEDVMVIVSLEISDETFTDTANVCIPAETLELLIGTLNSKYTKAKAQLDPKMEQQRKDILMEHLKETNAEITAYLGKTYMQLGEIAQLQPGDVITLNHRIDEDISVHIENIPWYTARTGEVDDKRAVKLVQAIPDKRKEKKG